MYPSFWQILVVLVILLVLFGHKRVRGIGKSLGESLKDFKKAMESEDQTEESSVASQKQDDPPSSKNQTSV